MARLVPTNTTNYYKWGGPNARVIGSPTVSNGVISNFTAANYLQVCNQIISPNSAWEIVLKFKTPSTSTGNQVLLDFSNGGGTRAISIYFAHSVKKLAYCLSSVTSGTNSIASDVGGATTLSYNTTYWVKLAFTGSKYTSHISTNGKTWTLDFSVTSSAKIYVPSNRGIGYYAPSTGLYWQGSIDLKECYARQHNTTTWTGLKLVTGTASDYVLTETTSAFGALSATTTTGYKYTTWTQPVFTTHCYNANGVFYRVSASRIHSTSYEAWKAFNGSVAANDGWWTGNIDVTESNPAWICLECSHKLKLTRVKMKGDSKGPENPKQGVVQVSNNGTSWANVGSFSFASNATGLEVTCALSVTEGYHFYRIYCTDEWADGVILGEVTYTGQIATENPNANIFVETHNHCLAITND